MIMFVVIRTPTIPSSNNCIKVLKMRVVHIACIYQIANHWGVFFGVWGIIRRKLHV